MNKRLAEKKPIVSTTFLIHLSVWVGYILYEHLIYFIVIQDIKIYFFETLLGFLANASLFYTVALYIYPKYLVGRNFFKAVLTSLGALSVFVLFKVLLKFYILPFVGSDWVQPIGSNRIYIAEATWRGGYYMLLGLGYWFAVHSYTVQKQKIVLEKAQYQNERKLLDMEKSLNRLEIDFFKAQINPHFLFNTLNFFYSKMIVPLPELAKGLGLLSEIMHYALQKHTTNGKVLLVDEVNHITNYILLQQTRFENKLNVNFRVEGMLDYKVIIPLVLMTLVENCFKHGDLYAPSCPIDILLKVTDDTLYFKTFNKKKVGKKERSTGIGLHNVKKILSNVYEDRCTFKINDFEEHYELSLTIKT